MSLILVHQYYEKVRHSFQRFDWKYLGYGSDYCRDDHQAAGNGG